ncbi:hypothetical protein TNIN_245591 [Trichonephila inaurata madagascariensis]|uniref:Uncharacterized protein n=1 Tax=Trichonephila inaurata madagascariensis TaxID=2747483 RepID=A0A8X6IYB5_9ARAC|nr:hypothetical protein TNIN_245591 [Trichonephila inaurata madagascariensis]
MASAFRLSQFVISSNVYVFLQWRRTSFLMASAPFNFVVEGASTDNQAHKTLSILLAVNGGLVNSRRHHTAILESAGPPDDTANLQKKPKTSKGLEKGI